MKLIAICTLLCVCLNARSANYYFSTTSGDDNRTTSEAQNPATPWKSISKLNAFFSQLQSGDKIYFKRGDVFYGGIVATKSGSSSAPIIFSAFGPGAKPVISGLSALTDWKPAGNNIFETSFSNAGKATHTLLINGRQKAPGRYPNANAASKGFLYFQSAEGYSSITDNQLNGFNFNGGEVVIRKTRWVLDRNKISQHNGNKINYASQSNYNSDNGYGYFIQNHPSTLDLDGEWYQNSATNTIGIYASAGAASLSNVQVATQDALVTIQNQSNLQFDNIIFKGSLQHGFFIKNAQQVNITDCELLDNGRNAITAENSSYLTVEKTIIDQTNNIAFNGTSCNNTILKGNTINCTGAIPGLGDGDAGSYEGILLSGDNNVIEQNQLDSTGYIPITFSGNNVVIKNNYISNYAFVKDDGGGIYTWNNSSNPPSNYNRVISGNILINGLGIGEGTSEPGKKYAHGVYIDDNATDVTINANTVSNCAAYGMYIHNARNLIITNNTLYNNQSQLVMQHDDIAPNSPIANCTVTGNIFFSLTADQPVAEFKTSRDDLANFGAINNNYYCRPINETASINTLKQVNGSYIFKQVDLDGWKAMYGKDANSKITSKSIKAFTVGQLIGGNKFANGNFDSNIGGLYAYAPANNCAPSWNNAALDGGTLQVSFSSQAGNNNKGTVVIGVGSITANKRYVLTFSLRGANNNTLLECYLRKSLAPYVDITDRKSVKVSQVRTEVSLFFVPTESQGDASLGIDIPEQNGPVFIDNIKLVEASVSITNPADSVKFIYNPTPTQASFSLANGFVDVANKSYRDNISLDAFASSVLLQTDGNATDPVTIPSPSNNATCSATGNILYEIWNNVGGATLDNNNWSSKPDNASQINLFEGQTNAQENYASRIRGYICPPLTGNYTFWIAGDDEVELYLSNNNDPTTKVKIAYNLSWTNPREWTRDASQKSALMYLEAGKKYYIEAKHKEGGGGDNLAVAWQLPTGAMEAPIPGSRLAPFENTVTTVADQTISFTTIADVALGAAPVTLSASASSNLPVSFRIISGPATLAGDVCTPTGVGVVVIEASQQGNAAYKAAALVTQTFTVLPLGTCSATGNILYEKWNNIGGNTIDNNNWNSQPDVLRSLTIFEGQTDVQDFYASRIRGYICAPITGNYTFWIAGDDATELYLSTSDNPAAKVKIAYSVSWTNPREWNKFATQKSATIYLQAGKKYYVEAKHKEGWGGDNLAVAWQLPTGALEAPIPGSRLSPYESMVNTLTDQSINFSALGDVALGAAPITLVATASSGLLVSFRVVSGSATVVGNICTPTGTGVVIIEASQAGNEAYNPAPAVTQSFTILATSTCSATGNILYEKWNNVGGNTLDNNNWNNQPNDVKQIAIFEGQTDAQDNYASRIRGYICPPLTGSYTFWIAGDDETELYLASSNDPAAKVRIAYNVGWTNSREWTRSATQKSAPIFLQAGKKYYIEAKHKEGGGGDNLAVAWQLPTGTMEAPIPGSRLSPYESAIKTLADQTISFTSIADVAFGSAPVTLIASASSGLPVSFKLVSGAATVVGNLCTPTGAGIVVIEVSQSGNDAYKPAPPVTIKFEVTSNVCAATGNILREFWSNVSGNNIYDFNWSTQPTNTNLITSFEGPQNVGDNYATRIRGYVCAPLDGYYTFWISSDDAAELYLSPDNLPGNKVKIAYLLAWTNYHEWDKYTSQKSVRVYLVAGKKYYIEAIQKEGGGGDHIEVGWEMPNGLQEMPVPGMRLSPYAGTSLQRQNLVNESKKGTGTNSLKVTPNPIRQSGTITFSVSENKQVTILLSDLQGRIIMQLYNTKANSGKTYSVPVNGAKLSAGLYFVKMITENEIRSEKVIKIN